MKHAAFIQTSGVSLPPNLKMPAIIILFNQCRRTDNFTTDIAKYPVPLICQLTLVRFLLHPIEHRLS